MPPMKLFRKAPQPDSAGQVLILGILALVALLLTIPILLSQQANSARFGIHSKRTTIAEEATEAGIALAVSQLSSTYMDWQSVMNMKPSIIHTALGYDGTRNFDNIPGV